MREGQLNTNDAGGSKTQGTDAPSHLPDPARTADRFSDRSADTTDTPPLSDGYRAFERSAGRTPLPQIRMPDSEVTAPRARQVQLPHPSWMPRLVATGPDQPDVIQGTVPDKTESTNERHTPAFTRTERPPDDELPIYQQTKDATGQTALPKHVVTGKTDVIQGTVPDRPTGEEPKGEARPWDKVPDREVQRMLDSMRPHDEIKVVLGTDVIEKVKEGPTRAEQPKVVIYGTKEGSWYAGLERPEDQAGTDTTVTKQAEDHIVIPKVTLRREPLDATALAHELGSQTGETGVRRASTAGDVEHIVLQVSPLEPPFDPTKFDSEHEFENGKVADIKQTGEGEDDSVANVVGEIKPTSVQSVSGGIFQGARQAYDAQLETGLPHDSYVLMYGRIQTDSKKPDNTA